MMTLVDTGLCSLEEKKGKHLRLSVCSNITPRPRAANKRGMRQRGASILPLLPLFLAGRLSCHGPNATQTRLLDRGRGRIFSLSLQGQFEKAGTVEQDNLSSSRQSQDDFHPTGEHTCSRGQLGCHRQKQAHETIRTAMSSYECVQRRVCLCL